MDRRDAILAENGRALMNMRDNSEGFQLLAAEIKERMTKYTGLVMNFKAGPPSADLGVQAMQPRYLELKEIMAWIDDEIEEGGKALERVREARETVLSGNLSRE